MDKQPHNLSQRNKNQISNLQSGGMFTARVRYAVLDDKTEPEAFENFGGWGALGGIFFSRISSPNKDKSFLSDSFAKPLFPNIKHIPLKNETVSIVSLSNSNIQGNVDSVSYYYFQPINIWNSTHHNAIPDPIIEDSLPDNQQQDYEETSIGNVRRVSDDGTEIDLGTTFNEKLEVKPTQPYEGDVIYEGRWGQSIRFGSTVKNSKIPNNWSDSGDDGDPITIIKNGQFEEGSEAWVPQVEDINKEKCVIFLTSTQKIPINVASKDYKSYTNPPISPSEYKTPQYILNAGRVLINAHEDSILLSSKKSINLNSKESVNVDSPKVHVNTKAVRLGDKEATEPMIFGDKFLTDFENLLNQVVLLTKALQTPIGTSVPYQVNVAIPPPAVKVETAATKMLNKIEAYKSKITKST